MNPRTITSTLIAIVIVLQLVSLGAVTQSRQARLDDQVRQAAVLQLDTHAKNLIIQTQQFLSPIASQLSISRQLIADGLLNASNNDTLERYFLSQVRSNESINAMYLGRYDGGFVAVARFDRSLVDSYRAPVLRSKVVSVVNGKREIVWREYSLNGVALNQWVDHADTYDPRVRAWYQNAKGHEQPVWTNAFSLNDSENLAIAASVNLHDQNHADAGVLGISVELSQLSALASAMSSDSETYAVILDNEFNQIATSAPNLSMVANAQDRHENVSHQIWHAGSGKLEPTTDAKGRPLPAVDTNWFSDNNELAHVQRRLHLFDGALQWRMLLQKTVMDINEAQREVVHEGIYQTTAIIVLPGMLALLLIFILGERIQRLHRRATIDFLTGAFNREEFMNRFSRRVASDASRLDRGERWIAVALDLDGFKQINDQYGHDAGDVILQSVVCRLQQRVGRSGFVGRLGGDEFAVALKLQHGMNVQAAVESIRRSVVKTPIKSARATHQVGMTAGIAVVNFQDTPDVALERADGALIAGKVVAKNATYLSSKKHVTRSAANAARHHAVSQTNKLKAHA